MAAGTGGNRCRVAVSETSSVKRQNTSSSSSSSSLAAAAAAAWVSVSTQRRCGLHETSLIDGTTHRANNCVNMTSVRPVRHGAAAKPIICTEYHPPPTRSGSTADTDGNGQTKNLRFWHSVLFQLSDIRFCSTIHQSFSLTATVYLLLSSAGSSHLPLPIRSSNVSLSYFSSSSFTPTHVLPAT